MHTPPRIAIDARYLSHNLVGGVHTYITNLVSALLAIDSESEYVLIADSKAPFELRDLPPNAQLITLPWSGRTSSIANDARIGTAILRAGADVAHFPANYGFAPARVPAVVTVHDAINLLPLHEIIRGHAKHPRVIATMTYLHLQTTRALRRQPMVVTVSEYSKREILRHARLPANRVRVIYSAPDAIFRPAPRGAVDALRARYQLCDRVILADAIKNPDCTLRAWRALPPATRQRASLVFFARRPPSDAVQRAAAAGESVLLLRPERDELVTLYSAADVFVFPSWYEGFGLPVLEAMACGTPVIASSRGALPEVAGEPGIIVDAEDHDTIARAIVDLFDGEQAAGLRERSLAWARRFTWERTALQMRQVYADVAPAPRAVETQPMRDAQPT